MIHAICSIWSDPNDTTDSTRPLVIFHIEKSLMPLDLLAVIQFINVSFDVYPNVI